MIGLNFQSAFLSAGIVLSIWIHLFLQVTPYNILYDGVFQMLGMAAPASASSTGSQQPSPGEDNPVPSAAGVFEERMTAVEAYEDEVSFIANAYESESSESDESYEEPTNNYWGFCEKCSYEKEYGHHGYTSHDSAAYPFLVLITVKAYNSTDKLNQTIYGNGFIASPHCVVTAFTLVSLDFYPKNVDYLIITISFCQHCTNKQSHYLGAFNRTTTVRRDGTVDPSSEGNCIYDNNFDPETLVYNVALIQFYNAIPFDCALPACWYDIKSEPNWYYPDLHPFPVKICGYGSNGTDMSYSPCQRCIKGYQGAQDKCGMEFEQDYYTVPYHDTCAFFPNNQHLCYGGGASVVLYQPHSNRKYSCPMVIGIASWTVTNCTAARPVVYVSTLLNKVSHFIKSNCNCLPIPPESYDDSYGN